MCCCPLLFLGIVNCHAAAQSTDQVLVKIVNQFKETSRNVNAREKDRTAPRRPSPLKTVECRTNAKDFCVYNSNNITFRTEDRCAGKAIVYWALEQDCINRLWSKVISKSAFTRDCAMQHERPWSGKRRNDGNLAIYVHFIPVTHFDEWQCRSFDFQFNEIIIYLVSRDLSSDRCGWIWGGYSFTEYQYHDLTRIFSIVRIACRDNVIGCNNSSIGGHDETCTREVIPYINLYNGISIGVVDFLPGQHILSVCTDSKNQKTSDQNQCDFHVTPPEIHRKERSELIATLD